MLESVPWFVKQSDVVPRRPSLAVVSCIGPCYYYLRIGVSLVSAGVRFDHKPVGGYGA